MAGFLFLEWINQHKEYPLKIKGTPVGIRWAIYYGLVAAILYLNTNHQAFIYFQF